ncbi:hypothetical protein N0V90_011551 [Kalmusia sp. IMI 367209]|nr:hypothetical protein N0V90_011551 [Kalmusia sp. IMI 367209]
MSPKTSMKQHLPELEQANDFDESSAMEREYEFFVTTEEPHQLEGHDRGRIRRVVMRNFFETKWSEQPHNMSEHNSKATVQKKTKLKSRFRLPKPGEEATVVTSRSKGRSIGEEQQNKKVTRKNLSRDLPDDLQQKIRSSALSRMPYFSDSEGSASDQVKATTKLVLSINPGAHQFDPFDVLPVPGSPELNILVKFYKSGARVNSIAINARSSWWSFIRNDPGLLHATLATWALYGTLVRRMNDLHVEKLKHKSEAIKEINRKISDPGGRISDELVGTVSILASFENLLGAYDAAQLHIAALKRMVKARGGLIAFGHNDGLVRGILWVDIHTAMVFRTPPSFPEVRLDLGTPPFPDDLLEEAAYTSPTSLLRLAIFAIECFNIFYRLHRLALAISSRWIRKVSRWTLSNLLYETEYMLLSIPDHSRNFLDFDLETKDEQDNTYTDRANVADAASVIEALLAAAQIFIYASLREVPLKAPLFSILLERLRIALDRVNVSTLGVWAKVNNSHMLLWILVVASSVASASGSRVWWIARLYEVIDKLGIQSFAELQGALERVAWTDVFFADMLGGIWQEANERAEIAEDTENT